MNTPSNFLHPHVSHPSRSGRGFTLVEILVTVVIIIVLAALSFIGFGRISQAASAATMSNSLRQLGTTIASYAQDNGDKLPGPLHLGQRPIYRSSPQTHLAYHLRAYLAPGQVLEERELVPNLSSRMWLKKSPTPGGISLLSQQDVDPDTRVSRNPWGYAGAAADDPNRQPITMAKLTGYGRLPWALVEADREHPLVGGAGWRTEMPEKPVHGNFRLALNFDGSVLQRYVNEDLQDKP